MAALTLLLLRTGLVDGVDPFVVGGLFDDRSPGVFALEVHAGRDQAVARGTTFGLGHVVAVDRHQADEVEHRLPLDGVFVLAPAVLAIDGVFDKGHLAAEPGADALGILLVAHGAAHTIEREAVGQRLEERVVFGAVMVRGEVAHRCMATRALVFESGGMAGIGDDLVPHLGSPERVLGAVGHDGTAPVVRDVDVPSVRQGLHGKGLSGDGGELIGVLAMASCAFARALE